MSIRSLTSIAVQRDNAAPKKADKDQRGGGADQPELVPQGWADVLIAAIPTEVLAVYTAVVGVVVGTIEEGKDELLALRWILYAATTAILVAWITAAYRRKRASKRRRFPLAELCAAVVAFGAWGLVMPGSPLAASLDSQWTAIWSAIITALGVVLLGMLGTPLKDKVK
jgi:hypothetical protein